MDYTINKENNEIGYINDSDLIFTPGKDIQSGGFSVSSIMMKAGMSPIMTMNNNTDNIIQNGGTNKVSDLFQNLAVPNWATMYNIKGGQYKEEDKKHNKEDSDNDSDIDDDLHDKLLELVKEHENKVNNNSKKNNKTKRKNKIDKNKITKRNKKNDK